MNNQEQKERHTFIKYLYGLSPEKDRGVLADLRRGFSKATETRSWPYIGRFCKLDADQRIVFQTIAAGYAINPKIDERPFADFGTMMLALSLTEKENERSVTFDVAFRRILACASVEDVCERLKAPILASKAKNVPIPWERLFWDLLTWDKRAEETKIKWAANYWHVPNVCDPVSIEQESEEEESLQ